MEIHAPMDSSKASSSDRAYALVGRNHHIVPITLLAAVMMRSVV
ncbi:hypothetical protein [Natronobacterium gregoryi]|nr:hypothetical protein [Natronobacterium gregoryi]